MNHLRLPRHVSRLALILAASALALFAVGHVSAGLPPDFIVNVRGDQPDPNLGDVSCDVDLGTNGKQCTLRAALEQAAGDVSIGFNISGCPPACTINVGSQLQVGQDFILDGTTQQGYSGTPLVILDGTTSAPGTNGLNLGAPSSTQIVRGLVIRNFPADGVYAPGVMSLEVADSAISGNGGHGISFYADLVDIHHNTISENGGDAISNNLGFTTAGSVIENTITGNIGAGLHLAPQGVFEVHFNRFAGNGPSGIQFTPGTRDETNNWWGCNAGPRQPGCDMASVSSNVDWDPWLVLDASADPPDIETGGQADISGDVTMNSDGDDTSGEGQIPDGTELEFETDLGSVGSHAVTKSTMDGIAHATLTGDEGTGSAHVRVTLDNASLMLAVTIFPAATPTPAVTPTASPTPHATPTATPSGKLTQGDVDCDTDVDSVDALKQLRHVAALSVAQTEPCPDIGSTVASLFGDVDCDNDVDSVDALKVLRHVAALSASQTEPCADIGTPK